MAFHRVCRLCPTLGRKPGVLLSVAYGQSGLIFRNGLLAMAVQIKHSPEIDM
jgi:hypothetical protein